MNSRNNFLWSACCVAVLLLTILCLTPFIIPIGKYEPMLFGVPYTLWTTILIAILIVGITFIGIYVHPGKESLEDCGHQKHNSAELNAEETSL